MKDITRIHIAKVPYSIELTAKKNLEKYIAALEAYTSDTELLEDIEIRMTELLLERNVKQEDVISDKDITAIRAQLGEPKDFMTDDATLDIDPEVLSGEKNRKLYRNLDTALLGGVLGGFASYFGINALWVRLAFIIVTFISFGVSILLYIILWVIIPPARSAAEKLQLAGRPVTLASIRELNESGSTVNTERRVRIQKRVATTLLGLFSIGGALLSLGALAGVTVELIRNDQQGFGESMVPYQPAIILGYVAGALLTSLFLLVAVAAFRQKFNKRIWISGVIIIALGLSTFAVAGGYAIYQNRLDYEEIQRNTVETSSVLPTDFASVKSLSVDAAGGAYVTYVADDAVTSVKQLGLKDAPKVKVTVENGVAKLHLDAPKTNGFRSGPTITVHGPRLDSVIVTNGQVSYETITQGALKAEVYNQSSLSIVGSRIDELTTRTDGTASLSTENAGVVAANLSINGQSSVNLGNIKSLTVTSPEVCPAYKVAHLSVETIVSRMFVHNGAELPIATKEGSCLIVEFGEGDSRSYDRRY